MTDKPLSEMSTEEFDAMIDAHIQRETSDTGELSTPLFYTALRDVFDAEQVPAFESTVEGDRLILSTPAGTTLPAHIREVEVALPGVRVLVKLEPLAG